MSKAIVISSYPSKKAVHGKGTVGVASYAKNTLGAIQRLQKTTTFTVLAEKLENENDYTQNNIKVKRIWKRNSFFAFFNILKELITKEKENKTVVVEFELAMFGDAAYVLPFPLFLLALKLLRKRVFLVCHQVIPNIEELGAHINVRENSILSGFINVALSLFYRILLILCDRVVVFEEILKTRLSKYGKKSKITVIPHGVEDFQSAPSKAKARKDLKLSPTSFIVLAFGFLAWYKGTDWLVHAIEHLKNDKKLKGKPIQLVLAGGANPNHMDKNYYYKYIEKIETECARNGVVITGFVAEKDIPSYFQASDLVVLPYRTLMSSSGPLSITFSFKKPFLLSPKLKGILMAEDIKSSLKALKLHEEDIMFSNFNDDFGKKLQKIRINSTFKKRLSVLANEIKEKRSWDIVGRRYYEEIFA